MARTVLIEKETTNVFAHACQNISEILLTADPSVLSILNVARIWLVLTKDAPVLVDPAFVVSMLSVTSSITMLSVPVSDFSKYFTHYKLNSEFVFYKAQYFS